jgi:hypothetical protein
MIFDNIELTMLRDALNNSELTLDTCKGSVVTLSRTKADRVVMLTKINDALNLPQNDG